MSLLAQEESLQHHGIIGQKWGVRRYQNEDGSLTPEGRRRLQISEKDSSVTKRVKNDYNTLSEKEFQAKYKVSKSRYEKRVRKYGDPYKYRKEHPTVLQKMGQNRKKIDQYKRDRDREFVKTTSSAIDDTNEACKRLYARYKQFEDGKISKKVLQTETLKDRDQLLKKYPKQDYAIYTIMATNANYIEQGKEPLSYRFDAKNKKITYY